MTRALANALAWLFFLIMLAAVIVESIDAVRGWRSRGWAVTSDAEVTTAAEVSAFRTPLKASVWYRYRVNGVEYVGNRIAFGLGPSGRPEIERIMAQYPKGPVRVHYNPVRPSESVLIPGVGLHPLDWILPAVGLVALTWIGWMLGRVARSRRSRRR